MSIDIAFCIESRDDAEMPETLFGCCNLLKPSIVWPEWVPGTAPAARSSCAVGDAAQSRGVAESTTSSAAASSSAVTDSAATAAVSGGKGEEVGGMDSVSKNSILMEQQPDKEEEEAQLGKSGGGGVDDPVLTETATET